MLEKVFHIRAAGSTPGREAVGGLTTFLTMAYIIFVNPIFLTAAGIPPEGAIIATCVGTAFATFLMAFLANYPIALAPGMGMNAFFAFGICLKANIPWPEALGLVFWAGILFFIFSITGARKAIVRAVPSVIKLSAAAGIGLFIAFIGFQHGGIIISSKDTLVTLGSLTSLPVLLTILGTAVTLVLSAINIRSAIFWGLLITLAMAFALGLVKAPDQIITVPKLDFPGFQIALLGALKWKYIPYLLILLFFDLFDTMGTLMGIAHAGGFLKNGEMPRIEKAMMADACGSLGGALLGTSTVTSYIESGAGVGVGAKTGFANIITGLLFLLALFFTPIVAIVGKGVLGALNPITAPALIVVGIMMIKVIDEIKWNDLTEAIPAFFTILLMPLTFSISHGLVAGIITYVLVKSAARRWDEIHWLIAALAIAFIVLYALLLIH